LKKKPTTVVTRVPKSLWGTMKFWKKALNFKTEKQAWEYVYKIYNSKSKKIYPEEIFKL